MVVEGQGSVTSDPAGIDCPSTCVGLFSAGETVDLTAHATSTSMVSLWLDDCAAPGTLTNPIVMDADKQCRIRFVDQAEVAIARFTFTPGIPRVGQVVNFDGNASCVFDAAANTCDPAGIASFAWDFDEDGMFEASGGRSAAAIAQYAFQTSGDHPVRLRVEGGEFFDRGNTVETVNVLDPAGTLFGLSVNKAGTGEGLIATDPPGLIRCDAICAGAGPVLVESGTVATLTAEPLARSNFAGWSGNGCVSGTASIQVSMDGARNCTATFSQIPSGPVACFNVSNSSLFSLDLDGSCSTGSGLTYKWWCDFIGEGQPPEPTGGPGVNCRYETPGDKLVRLEVIDSSGNSAVTSRNIDTSSP